MGRIAIRAENLGKRYRLGQLEPYKTLRDAITRAARTAFRHPSSGHADRGGSSENPHPRGYIWALKDVSFEVEEGEALGIIGPNGAGKTTLLKVLSRITEPTEGQVELQGKVGSLLEVGTGFHPELTGKENAYFNGAVLGMTKREIDEKYEEIVHFCELEEFMETPVKRFSSGMQVRLAFAVAAHLEPEILLVDEVLAVGDAAFQKKCLGKMGDVTKEGRTVLFVSHNLGAIRGLCPRAIWLHKGRIRMDGDVQKVVSAYMTAVSGGFAEETAKPNELVEVRRVVLRNAQGESTLNFRTGADLVVEIHYRARVRIERPYFWIGIGDKYGSVIGANMLFDGHRPEAVEDDGVLTCVFKSLPLIPRQYMIRFGARARDGVTFIRESRDIAFFNVVGTMKDYGFEGEAADAISWDSAPVVIPYEWILPDGQVRPVSIKREGRGS